MLVAAAEASMAQLRRQGVSDMSIRPDNAISLGLMMNNALAWSALQLHLWWWFVPPGAGITAVVGALYVMNVGLDEVFNPKLREM